MVKYSEDYWKAVRQVLSVVPNISKIFNKSILITGATGMICSSVVELLLELNKSYNANLGIYLAGRSKKRVDERFYGFSEGVDYTFVNYDASSDEQLCINADYVIHGASPADPASISAKPVETMMANIYGLGILFELVKKDLNSRLLFISSSEVYGRKKESGPFKESDYGYVDILNPRASYPSSKRAAETLCASYMREYGVDFVVVRPGHIYGPTITDYDSRASAQFTRKAVAGEDIIMKSAGTQLRSYTYILDCASAILTVLLNGTKGEAYNISNPNSIVTIRELAECLAQTAGVKLVFECASAQEAKCYNLMDNSSLNSSKLERLGWKSLFRLEDGVTATLKCFLN